VITHVAGGDIMILTDSLPGQAAYGASIARLFMAMEDIFGVSLALHFWLAQAACSRANRGHQPPLGVGCLAGTSCQKCHHCRRQLVAHKTSRQQQLLAADFDAASQRHTRQAS